MTDERLSDLETIAASSTDPQFAGVGFKAAVVQELIAEVRRLQKELEREKRVECRNPEHRMLCGF